MIGILHPGEMGASVAAAIRGGGRDVIWASEGRSHATRARARSVSLQDVGTVAALCAKASTIISVCPPHAAERVAEQVLGHAFRGTYVDANAISPGRAVHIGRTMTASGTTFVDGGIIGPPAWKRGTTRLYLSGPGAAGVAACFSSGPLEALVLGDQAGKASALKMCFAAYTKGSAALLAAILAAADRLDVRDALNEQWALDGSGFAQQAEQRVQQSVSKAWRFAGEMEEIAATFRDAGVPGGFHAAAAEIFRRLDRFKDAGPAALDEVLAALLQAEPAGKA